MKKLFLAMTAITALAAAAPAAAQYGNQSYGAGADVGIDNRIAQLEARLQAGIQAGTIDRREAFSLRQQLLQLRRLERRYSYNGLTVQERADLQQRLRTLRQQMRAADGGLGYGRNEDDRWGDTGGYGQSGRIDRNNDGYDDRDYNRNGRWDDEMSDGRYVDRNNDGYDDRDYNRNGRWDDETSDGRYVDRNNDGYDDRDYNRNGRWDDEMSDGRYVDRNNDGYDDRDYNRNGRWEDDVSDGRYRQTDDRGIVERVIDTVTGGATLRVGQRVSGNLSAVPYEYRGQYRDGGGVYYRSDGRAIYEIDARTDTVLRIYAMNR